jgi:hypothetical protein
MGRFGASAGTRARSIGAVSAAVLVCIGTCASSPASASARKHRPKSSAAGQKARAPGMAVHYEFGELAIDPGTLLVHTSCPKGYIVIGGGFRVEDSRVQVLQSSPFNSTRSSSTSGSNNAWAVIFNNPTTGKQVVRLYAICISGAKVK